MKEDLGKEMAIEAAKAVAVEGYKDTLQPTLKTVGGIIALPFQAIDAALSKPKLWVAEKHYNYERTLELLYEKLKNTPEEQIVPPENYVAVPALQQISYCFDSDELRDMYANLLANSMNKVVKNGVHPGFVEIIKQLSPDEAKILKYMSGASSIPTISLKYSNESGGIEVIHNFSIVGEQAGCENPYDVSKYFDNLVRLGLLDDAKGMAFLINKSLYDPLKKHRLIIPHATDEKAKEQGFNKHEFSESYVKLTSYGKSFCDICLTTQKGIVITIDDN